MRKKIMLMIDLEDQSPESENWLVDTVALENSIRDCLEVPEVTIHDMDLEVYE